MNNHDSLGSFIPVAPESHFPIQNLPYGVFGHPQTHAPTIGVAIGDWVLDVTALESQGILAVDSQKGKRFFAGGALNPFLAAGKTAWKEVRRRLTDLLNADNPLLRDNKSLRHQVLHSCQGLSMLLPVAIGDYTDFYSSREHATNVGIMLRGPANALQPNWLHLPVAYHARSSTIVVSGSPVRRPSGQTKADDAPGPAFGPSRNLDFELEMGFFIGPGNEWGRPIPIGEAADHIFGMVLVNDWSARDIQKWEYVPLGPFLAKNFATSISPWVVPIEALEPYRIAGPAQEPTPLPYLAYEGTGTFDIHLEASLKTASMKEPERICRTNFKHLYWNIYQQLTHHASNGCQMRPGDLLASGTISGPTPDSFGSLLELAWKGTKPIVLSNGERRTFLQDGDTLRLTGWCQGNGYRVGFGDVSGTILPALAAGTEKAQS